MFFKSFITNSLIVVSICLVLLSLGGVDVLLRIIASSPVVLPVLVIGSLVIGGISALFGRLRYFILFAVLYSVLEFFLEGMSSWRSYETPVVVWAVWMLLVIVLGVRYIISPQTSRKMLMSFVLIAILFASFHKPLLITLQKLNGTYVCRSCINRDFIPSMQPVESSEGS